MIQVQSYGGGVQSVALLHLAILGIGGIPQPDLVVFGDTHNEPASVYEAIERDKQYCEAAGIPFVVLSYDNLFAPKQGIHTPLYTTVTEPYMRKRKRKLLGVVPFGEKDEIAVKVGAKGQLLRTCTERFKIRPIRQYLRRIGVNRATMWIGISTDEIERMKPSPLKWIDHRFPLIDIGFSRQDCLDFLEFRGIKVSKSACVFCPYRSAAQWAQLTESELARAIEYDERIRHIRPKHLSFVHSSRLPLKDAIEIDLTKLNDGLTHDNENLIQDECSGNCWT